MTEAALKRRAAIQRIELPFCKDISMEIPELGAAEPYWHLFALLKAMPDRLSGRENIGPYSDITNFYYNLYCMMMDVEFNIWIDDYKPITHLLHKYAKVKEPLSLALVKQQKNLLAYSGGKESVLANDMFQTLGIPMHHVTMHDRCQMNDFTSVIDQEAPIVIHKHLDPLFGLTGSPQIYPMFVAIQRLLILYWAEMKGYDNVFFGDEKERQEMYWVKYRDKGFIYPTHDYFQTQNYYNLLAEHFGLKVRAYSATSMFTQLSIVTILANKGKLHYCSCSRTAPKWCGKCDKCQRIASLCKTAAVQKPDGLAIEGVNLFEERNHRSALGIYDGKYDCGVYRIRELSQSIEENETFVPWDNFFVKQVIDHYDQYL
jgi:hypothetical protein